MKRNASCFASFSLVFAKLKNNFSLHFSLFGFDFFVLFRFKPFDSNQKNTFSVILLRPVRFKARFFAITHSLLLFASKHFFRYIFPSTFFQKRHENVCSLKECIPFLRHKLLPKGPLK
jgi:hypothetical protein